MVLLLAGLAERYGVDPAPGATTTFVSRGSNRWPAGASVTTSTIAGHRDMSMTTCPGDAAYPLVKEAFPAEVTLVLAARRPPPAPASEPPPAAPTSAAPDEPTTPTATSAGATAAKASAGKDGVDASTVALIAGGAAVAAGLGAVQYARSRSAATKQTPGTGVGTVGVTSDVPGDRPHAAEGSSM
jgi:hypothetical protein